MPVNRVLSPADAALVAGNPQLELLKSRWEDAAAGGGMLAEMDAWHRFHQAVIYARHEVANADVRAWVEAFGAIV